MQTNGKEAEPASLQEANQLAQEAAQSPLPAFSDDESPTASKTAGASAAAGAPAGKVVPALQAQPILIQERYSFLRGVEPSSVCQAGTLPWWRALRYRAALGQVPHRRH